MSTFKLCSLFQTFCSWIISILKFTASQLLLLEQLLLQLNILETLGNRLYYSIKNCHEESKKPKKESIHHMFAYLIICTSVQAYEQGFWATVLENAMCGTAEDSNSSSVALQSKNNTIIYGAC